MPSTEYMQKIAITGPESTGKTTLSEQLAAHYQTVFVPEYARFYLEQLDRPYTPDDVVAIARGQLKWEAEYTTKANKFLFCDTELIVTKVWLKFKYNLENEWMEAALKTQKYDLYLLCNIDLPWQYDPLREHPNLHDRARLYELYRQELQSLDANFVEITGDETTRFLQAKRVIGER